MNEPKATLEFERATLPAGSRLQIEMRAVHFRLLPGQMALVLIESGNDHLPLADAAVGLIAPSAGAVRFMGETWAGMDPDRELALRARIGRVFDGHGWISNLNVMENITLSQRHHTLRPVREIIAEAEAAARQFGLAEVPKVRPAFVPPRDLRRAEWVRAFLGQPALVVLERPCQGIAFEYIVGLNDAVAAARARGAAVVWTTAEARVWQAPGLADALRFAMKGNSLESVPAEKA